MIINLLVHVSEDCVAGYSSYGLAERWWTAAQCFGVANHAPDRFRYLLWYAGNLLIFGSQHEIDTKVELFIVKIDFAHFFLFIKVDGSLVRLDAWILHVG